MKNWGLAWRFLRRGSRLIEWRMLIVSTVMAVAFSTLITGLSEHISHSFNQQSAELVGGDLVLKGSIPFTLPQSLKMVNEPLKHAESVEFSTMLLGLSQTQAPVLSLVKAVSVDYPLKGAVISQSLNDNAKLISAQDHSAYDENRPSAGEIWIDERLAQRLSLKKDQMLSVGAAQFKVARLLISTPDQASGLFHLMPQVLIRSEDLPSTQAIQPGSRITYRNYWMGPDTDIIAFQKKMTEQLSPQQSWVSSTENNSGRGMALDKVLFFLNFTNTLVLLLCGLGMVLTAQRYVQLQMPMAALFKSLGMTSEKLQWLYTLQIILMGIMSCVLGWLLGLALVAACEPWMMSWLPRAPSSWQLGDTFWSMIWGGLCLMVFVLPSVLNLAKTPMYFLLRDATNPHDRYSQLTIITGTALLLALTAWRSGEWLATLVTSSVVLVLYVMLWLVLKALKPWVFKHLLEWPLGLRLALNHWVTRPAISAMQFQAFGIIFCVLGLTLLVKTDVLPQWQAQLPPDAPNTFVLNVLPEQAQSFEHELVKIHAKSERLYPMTMGKLIAINDHLIHTENEKDPELRRTLERDFGLSQSLEIPKGNRLTEGGWWTNIADKNQPPELSVESKLAESLHLKLQDRLKFQVGGQVVEGRITSFRALRWESMQPNFFMLFQPEALSNTGFNLITSFYLPKGQSLDTLRANYPNVSWFDLTALISQLQELMDQIFWIIQLLIFLLLAASTLVLVASFQLIQHERQQQNALLRILGLTTQRLTKLRRTEWLSMGFISGLLAYLSAEALSYFLYRQLKLQWSMHYELMILPLAVALAIWCLGMLFTRASLKVQPLTLLRS